MRPCNTGTSKGPNDGVEQGPSNDAMLARRPEVAVYIALLLGSKCIFFVVRILLWFSLTAEIAPLSYAPRCKATTNIDAESLLVDGSTGIV